MIIFLTGLFIGIYLGVIMVLLIRIIKVGDNYEDE